MPQTKIGSGFVATGAVGPTSLSTGAPYWDTSGNVGIGTSSPVGKLHVNAASGAAVSLVQATAGNAAWLGLLGNGSSFLSGDFDLFHDGTQAGINMRANLPMVFSTNNSERMRIDSSGNLMVGTTSAVGKVTVSGNLTVQGGDNSINRSGGNGWLMVSSNQGYGTAGAHLKLDGGGGVWIFNNTTSTFYVASTGIYSTTTASAANMYVDSGNQLYRSTSSLKYKTDVVDATHGLAEVMQLRPVTYKGKNDGDKVFGGLIAEEVDEVGLTEFVQYAEDGSPDALAYGNMVSLLVKAIQELTAKVTALEAKVGP